jgi:hypothetical protein
VLKGRTTAAASLTQLDLPALADQEISGQSTNQDERGKPRRQLPSLRFKQLSVQK